MRATVATENILCVYDPETAALEKSNLIPYDMVIAIRERLPPPNHQPASQKHHNLDFCPS
jgi:hypothetical protein